VTHDFSLSLSTLVACRSFSSLPVERLFYVPACSWRVILRSKPLPCRYFLPRNISLFDPLLPPFLLNSSGTITESQRLYKTSMSFEKGPPRRTLSLPDMHSVDAVFVPPMRILMRSEFSLLRLFYPFCVQLFLLSADKVVLFFSRMV